MPPTNSTKMSASEESTSWMLSVQRTLGGTQSTFFWATLRLKMWVNSKLLFASWQSSLATERPTVPKPARAIFNFLWARLCFLDSSLFSDFDFARFTFAANSSPRSQQGQGSTSLKSARIIRYFGIQPAESNGKTGNATRDARAESNATWRRSTIGYRRT